MNRLPMTAMIGELGTRGAKAARGPDNQQMFLRARRHSRKVRLLRIAIPVVATAVLAGIALASWLDPLRVLARLPTGGGSLVISGTKITMASPKLTGFTKDSRAYELIARAAAQDITNPDIVELSDIRAKIETQDKSTINVTAIDGVYNRKSGQLKLARDVLMTTPAYQVSLSEANIDTGTSTVVSDKPVEVRMLQGTVNSKRLEVTNGGQVIRFTGDVVMKLHSLPENVGEKAATR